MTQEECIGLLKRYAEYDGMGIPNLAGCKEAMRMAAELLERPSLPSNLDEAAERYAPVLKTYSPTRGIDVDCNLQIRAGFKAGAEWMAEQGNSIECDIEWYDGPFLGITEEQMLDATKDFKVGDKVIVQIREK